MKVIDRLHEALGIRVPLATIAAYLKELLPGLEGIEDRLDKLEKVVAVVASQFLRHRRLSESARVIIWTTSRDAWRTLTLPEIDGFATLVIDEECYFDRWLVLGERRAAEFLVGAKALDLGIDGRFNECLNLHVLAGTKLSVRFSDGS